jgi:3-hydroxy-9,10-secoandrosta-1,3,5(10)-triene-9,17-dione monooxygenase
MNVHAVSARPVFATRADAVARARELTPLLRAGADAADANRDVAAETIAAVSASGLFRVMAPRAFGGSQLGLATLIEVAAELASGCGSTGWLYAVLGGHNWLASLFPLETQREIFSDPDALVASVVRLGGARPRPVEGGYRVRDAVGKYCSGGTHADWIVLGAGVERDDGVVEPTYLLVPKSDVEIVDDWFTVGLRGTGSRTLRIADAFVPARRAIAIADLSRGASPGARLHDVPAYRAPFPQILAISLAGVPIGIARAGLAAYRDAFRARVAGWPAAQVAEQGGFFMRVAEAGADIDAAFALVMKDCLEIDAAVDGNRTAPIDRARYMRDISHAAWRCRLAVNSLFEASGGSAVYDTHGLQRIWRDINAAAAHNSFVRERAGGMYGRAALGVEPSAFDRIGH